MVLVSVSDPLRPRYTVGVRVAGVAQRRRQQPAVRREFAAAVKAVMVFSHGDAQTQQSSVTSCEVQTWMCVCAAAEVRSTVCVVDGAHGSRGCFGSTFGLSLPL